MFEWLGNLISSLPPGWQLLVWLVIIFVSLGVIVAIIQISKLLLEAAIEGIVLGTSWLFIRTLEIIWSFLTYPFRKARHVFRVYRLRRMTKNKADGKPQNESEPQEEEKAPPPVVDISINYNRAVEIFDLQSNEDFTLSDLKRRYRSVIRNVHPDKGGSNFFAKQANEALRVIKQNKGW